MLVDICEETCMYCIHITLFAIHIIVSIQFNTHSVQGEMGAHVRRLIEYKYFALNEFVSSGYAHFARNKLGSISITLWYNALSSTTFKLDFHTHCISSPSPSKVSLTIARCMLSQLLHSLAKSWTSYSYHSIPQTKIQKCFCFGFDMSYLCFVFSFSYIGGVCTTLGRFITLMICPHFSNSNDQLSLKGILPLKVKECWEWTTLCHTSFFWS